MIDFTGKDYKNLHLSIHEDKVRIVVSLNITKEMRRHLHPKCVGFKNKRNTYFLSRTLELNGINEQKILSTANFLIDLAMENCREAKKCVLSDEIAAIRHQPPRITSNDNSYEHLKI